MALKTWTTQYPGALDTTTQMPEVADGDDTDDTQLNTIGTVLRQLETYVGTSSPASGSIRYRLDQLEAVGHWESADISTGLGETTHFAHADNEVTALVAQNAALDADNGRVFALVFDRNAAALDYPSTLKLLSAGWTNNSNAFQEKFSVYGDGHIVSASNIQAGTYVQSGGQLTMYANVDGGYGIIGDHFYTGSGLEVIFASNRTDSANNRVFTFIGYTGTGSNFAQASTMRLASWGYSTSTPTYNEVAAVYADGDISCVELRAGAVQCTNSASGINVASVLKIDSSYDRSVGLGGASTNLAKVTADTEFALIHTTRGDSADNRVFTAVYAPGADTLSAEATIRLLSVGWSTTTPTYQEKFSVRANGDAYVTRHLNVTNAAYIGDSIVMGTTRVTRSPAVTGDAGILDINSASQELVLLHRNRTDGASNRVVTIAANTGLAGNFTQAATMPLLSVGYVDTVGPTYNEMFALLADGDLAVAKNIEAGGYVSASSLNITMTDLASGASNLMGTNTLTYGLLGPATTSRTMGFQSRAASGSGEISFSFAADVAASSIAADHIVCQWGWTSDADAYTYLMHLEGDGTLELDGTGTSTIEGQETDGATAIGLLVSTGATYSTSGAKLFSVQNNYSEEFYVSYNGHAVGGYFTADGSNAYITCGSSIYMQSNTDRSLASTGDLNGVADHLVTITDYPLIISSTNASRDTPNAFITAVIYDRGGATWTNAATSRLMSWGWYNDTDYQEKAYVRGDGLVVSANGFTANAGNVYAAAHVEAEGGTIILDDQPSYFGIDSRGMRLDSSGDELHIFHQNRADSVNNRIVTLGGRTSSTGNYAQAATMRLLSVGYCTTTPTYNEVFYVLANGAVSASAAILTSSFFKSNTNFWMYGGYDADWAASGDLSGVTNNVYTSDNEPIVIGSTNTSRDAANAYISVVAFNRNATSLTNGATLRLLAGGWTDSSDGFHEMMSLYGTGDLELAAGGQTSLPGEANGAKLKIGNKQELVSIAAAATTDSTITIPADCLFLGYSIRIVTQPTGTTSVDVGVSGDTQRFATAVSTTGGTTDSNCSDAHDRYSSAQAIRFTPNATPSAADGEIRLTIHYVEFTAATA